MQKTNHSTKIISALSWHSFMLLSMGIMQAVVTSVLARHISPQDFGNIGSAMLVVGFLAVFANGSIVRTLISVSNLDKSVFNACFTYSIFLGSIFLILLNAFASKINTLTDLRIDVVLLSALGFLLVVNSVGNVVEASLEKAFNLKPVAIINLVSYLLGFGFVGITTAILNYGVWSLAYAMITQAVIKSILLFRFRPYPFGITFKCSYRNKLLRFNTGFTLTSCVDYVTQYIDKLIVLKYFSTSALGIYQMAFTISELIRRFIGSLVEKTIFPSFSHFQDNDEELNRQYLFSIEIACLIMSIASFYMLANASEIVRVLLGEQWGEVVPILSLLLLQVPMRVVVRITDSYVNALGKTYSIFARKVLYLLLLLPACLFGVTYGVVGVMYGVLISVFFTMIFSLIHIYLLKRILVKTVGKSILLGLSFGFFIYFMNSIILQYFIAMEINPFLRLILTATTTGIILLLSAYIFRNTNVISAVWLPVKREWKSK